MESARILPLEPALDREREHELELVEGAVRLVASGAARRVSLGSLAEADAIAASGAAIAQTYGVRFQVERRPDGGSAIVVGPLDVG
ncbi:MAG: hypothetical protein ACXWO7_10605 [Candidatus Limnocylindrales bacterium]